jgi:hypothetical protein
LAGVAQCLRIPENPYSSLITTQRNGKDFVPRATQRGRSVCLKPVEEEAYSVSKIILGGNKIILSHQMVEAASAQLRRSCKAIYDVKRIK